jgi:hypothetical protein
MVSYNRRVTRHPSRRRRRPPAASPNPTNMKTYGHERKHMMKQKEMRSNAIVVGSVLAMVAVTACVCSAVDDDDCGSLAPTGTVFAAGSSLRVAEPPVPSAAEPIPASGGFGTHLASCGG